jgi:hypothetical protein
MKVTNDGNISVTMDYLDYSLIVTALEKGKEAFSNEGSEELVSELSELISALENPEVERSPLRQMLDEYDRLQRAERAESEKEFYELETDLIARYFENVGLPKGTAVKIAEQTEWADSEVSGMITALQVKAGEAGEEAAK